MNYDKPALTLDDQLAHLRGKGLHIPDEDRAKRYLTTIGLFRLKSYAPPFHAKGNKVFAPGTTFDDLLDLYIFDRKLRALALDALDRIEIAVRSVISNTMSTREGAHWFLERDCFDSRFSSPNGDGGKSRFELFIKELRRCTRADRDEAHPACRHYFETYETPGLPPSWIVGEVASMGVWSRVYSALRRTKYKKLIAGTFGFDHKDFGGWIHELSILRNQCAHHQRIWNRSLPPKARNVDAYTHPKIAPHTPYAKFAMIYAMLCAFTNDSEWNRKFHALVEASPVDMHAASGFPQGWEREEFWRLG
ncbi:abortive infection bacteriophage resistance protein [Desulfobaculum xiamenense]|uniref:Abortive infection bacteriophage resistance protein n=1 Tax=Desulfobaculum xiamenense TaxID=995050 RepID=A0A846QJ08_9BACT|nr:Abi family protein [Desulfobaculum xiamenense]NJB66452.1 abortive infection bacteriophage resistance protein [Desulfobaculum xiamenense]